MRRARKALLFAALLACAVGAAWFPWCRRAHRPGPRVVASGFSREPLRAGTARSPVLLHFPVPVAGYPPPRPDVSSAVVPLETRAVVLASGPLRVGIVSSDILLVPEDLASDVRSDAQALGLAEVFVVATHAHTSLGGYEERWVGQVGGTGTFHPEIRAALRSALLESLARATEALQPIQLRAAHAQVALNLSRHGVPGTDERLDRVALVSEGTGTTLGEVDIYAAHATLADHPPSVLDVDFPGRLALEEAKRGHGVTLFLQGAEGNAKPRVGEGTAAPATERFAQQLAAALGDLELSASPASSLGFARVEVSLPAPDSSRQFPPWARGVGNNALCLAGAPTAYVSVLQLGALRLLFVPGEPTWQVAPQLEAAARADRVVALTDGWLGYIDAPSLVRAHQGESGLAFFGPQLVDELATGARRAAEALDAAAR